MKAPFRMMVKTPFLILLFSFSCLTSWCIAQDPFDANGGMNDSQDALTNDDLFGNATDATPAPKSDVPLTQDDRVSERSAVVLSLRANPPKTPADLARAIQWMVRIRRWDEAGRWLDETAKLGINESVATRMTEAVGTHTFRSLLSPEVELNEKRRANVQKILDLSIAASNNPKRLSQNVNALRSKNKAERIQGFRSLQAAGNRGIQALINSLLADGSLPPSPTMCEALSLLGPSAWSAWQAAMTTPYADARGRLALLAARIADPAITTEILIAASDPSIDADVRDQITTILADRGRELPKRSAMHRYALDQMNKSLQDFDRERWTDDADAFIAWRLGPEGRSVYETPARLSDLKWTRTVQLANACLIASDEVDIYSALAVAVLLEDAARGDLDSVSIESAVPKLPELMRESYEFGCLVYDATAKYHLSSAEFVTIKHLCRWANAETIPSAVRERLAAALGSGYSAVRYQAAEGLLGAMYLPQQDGTTKFIDIHFDGRNRLERILAEMRTLEGKPVALVVGGSAELKTHIAMFLETFGYEVDQAASAGGAIARIKEARPVDAVFIVDRVSEMSLGQLVQRIRGNPTTSDCPIALLAASLSNGDHLVAKADHRVVMGSVPPEQADFADILRRMRLVTQSPQIGSSNRNLWRELSDNYWRETQNRWVSSQPKAELFDVVDTPVSQLQLIQMAIDNSKPLPQREQASQKFVQSVKQFGLLLSTETANAQYDEYNRRGPDEPDLRVILGRILDGIEAANGAKSWEEVAP